MAINIQRLSGLLHGKGFVLAFDEPSVQETLFVRASSVKPLFELLKTKCGVGAGVPIVHAYAECAAVPGRTVIKSMCAVSLLRGISASWKDGGSWIRSEEDAEDLERGIAQHGPTLARELSLSNGVQLLDRTAAARQAVDRYLALLPSGDNDEILVEKIRSKATPQQRSVFEQFQRRHPYIPIPTAPFAYDLATWLLLIHHEAVEEVSWDFTTLNFNFPDLKELQISMRWKILASRLAKEIGWTLL